MLCTWEGSVLRVRFARGDMHMLLGVVWLVWCGILSALYLGERGAGSMLRVVRRLGSSTVYPGAGRTSVLRNVVLRSRDVVLRGLSATLNVAGRKALASSAARFVKY